ncbi:MAG: NfeD family protein [Clostridia bacterium]|nr:NfeD family protein [Clostridia bacterium]
MPYFWIAVLALALLTEAFTSDLVAIWFFPAALISTLLAFFNVPVPVQILVFVAVGLVLVFSTRPLCKKLLKNKNTKTNVDALIGESALVTEEISNICERGEVKLHGLRWSARAKDPDCIIPVGTQVEVLEVKGVKLIVK